MRNEYKWDGELQELIVTQTESKTLEDIRRVICKGKNEVVIDKFVSLYLPTSVPDQVVADKWYEQHLLVASSDQDEERFTRTFTDENGDEQVEVLPNKYEVALAARTELETSHEWLKGLLGEVAPERPVYTTSIDDFKLDNEDLFDEYKKRNGVTINGSSISLNASNQHGLADISIMIDKASKHSINPFPINIILDSSHGESKILINDQNEFDNLFIEFGLARQEFFK